MIKGLTEINLPPQVARKFENFTKKLDFYNNPYNDHEKLIANVGGRLFDILIRHREDPEVAKLLKIIKDKAEDKGLEAVIINGGPQDAEHHILEAPYHVKGFDYQNDPKARGKNTFVAEWFELALGALLGFKPSMDPHDYDGNKAFQIISPKEGRESTSSGQGSKVSFHKHTENSYANPYNTRQETLEYLRREFGDDLERVTNSRAMDVEQLIDGMMTCVAKQINGLILTATKNRNTPTRITTAQSVEVALKERFGEEMLPKIADLKIAYITGATQTGNVGVIGFVGHMIKLDEAGHIKGMLFNFAPGRMDYFGTDPAERKLYHEVHQFMQEVDLGKDILLKTGQYLFLDNERTCHQRDPLAPEDFAIPLQEGDLMNIRRLVREQLASGGQGFAQRIMQRSRSGVQTLLGE